MFTYQGLIFETPPPCRAQARGGRMGIRDWKNIGGLVNCAIDDEVSRGGGLSSSLSSRAFGRCIRGFITNRQGVMFTYTSVLLLVFARVVRFSRAKNEQRERTVFF